MRRSIIAILRGLNSAEAVDIANVVVDAGVSFLEPFKSIEKIVISVGCG